MAGHSEPSVTWVYAKMKQDVPVTFVDGSNDVLNAGEIVRVYKGSIGSGGATLDNKGYTSPTGGVFLVEVLPNSDQFWMAYPSNVPGADKIDSAEFNADTSSRQGRVGFARIADVNAAPEPKGDKDTIGIRDPGQSAPTGAGAGIGVLAVILAALGIARASKRQS